MTLKERVEQEVAVLNERQLEQVANFLSSFHSHTDERQHSEGSETQSKWERLYSEFAEEDREMADSGMKEYGFALIHEDNLA